MKAVFPGRPQAKLQAVATALWEDQRLVVYISSSTLIILGGPNDLLQSISHDEHKVLEAVSISESSGKIATCTKSEVYIYIPYGREEGILKWSLQHVLTPKCGDTRLASLSWGQPREVLAGGSYLTLLDTSSSPREVWTKEMANPVEYAAFTPDASFIASTGWHDRLVKVWRRLFLGEDEESFDISYLPHPAKVTSVRWHRRPNQSYHCDTVLYTTCVDLKLRIWAATDHHGLQALQLWSELDLVRSVIPALPPPPDAMPRRFVFIMDGWEFEDTVEHAIQRGGVDEQEQHACEHLMDVAYRNPDVCVIMDNLGNMSAWGLERVGCKARQPNDIFNIAIIEDLHLRFQKQNEPLFDHLCLFDFGDTRDGSINVLAHYLDGRVEWLKSPIDRLFASTPAKQRFKIESTWTGHGDPVIDLVLSPKGDLVLSRTHGKEFILWSQDASTATTIAKTDDFKLSEEADQCCFSVCGRYAVFLHENHVSWIDLSSSGSHDSKQLSHNLTNDSACLTSIANPLDSDSSYFVLLSPGGGIMWSTASGRQFILSMTGNSNTNDIGRDETFANGGNGTANCLLYSISTNGSIYRWSLDNKSLSLTRTLLFETFVSNVKLFVVDTGGLAAITDASTSQITIWNLQHAQLEFEEQFASHESIGALDFGRTKDGCNILAIALQRKILIYAEAWQTPNDTGAGWCRVSVVELGDITSFHIAACAWLVGENIALAAGNQLFVQEPKAELPKITQDTLRQIENHGAENPLSTVAWSLNGMLPSFHPDVLVQYILAGQSGQVDIVLFRLHQKLRYWTTGDYLPSNMLEADEPEANGHLTNGDSSKHDHDAAFPEYLSEESATLLNETLEKVELPYISAADQSRLLAFFSSFGALERYRKSVDDAGLRYIVQLRRTEPHEIDSGSSLELWRHIAWASQSNTQDVLVDLTSRAYSGKMLWQDARQCGIFMWISDIDALRAQFEVIARNEYTKTNERNPIDCTLHYLALRKKPVLVGLWRMANWNKEQRATQKMLANNFNDPRWKTAAMKNAYALLGRRRFEYAAAFFLLAGQLKDAVGIIASQVGDLQLAITVARVYEGDGGPVLKELLETRALPQAVREGNRWLASWTFWMLGVKDKAMQALIHPLESLYSTPEGLTHQTRHIRNSEPALAHYYAHLRRHIETTPGDRTQFPCLKDEHDLVLRSAVNYARAGCLGLALELVRGWKYTTRSTFKSFINREMSKLESGKSEDLEENGDTRVEVPDEPAPTTLNSEQRKKVVAAPSEASIFDNFNF